MATAVIVVVRVAPCQCFSPGGNHTTSPGRISSRGPRFFPIVCPDLPVPVAVQLFTAPRVAEHGFMSTSRSANIKESGKAEPPNFLMNAVLISDGLVRRYCRN